MYLTKIAERIREALPRGVVAPDRSDSLFMLYALLATAKGSKTTLVDVHNAWAIWQFEKDSTHKALVPFEALSSGIKQEDEPFLQAILEVAAEIEAD